jgi:ABC-2 type transport system ATP-binding protein
MKSKRRKMKGTLPMEMHPGGSEPENIIVTHDLTRHFGKLVAVDQLNLEVRRGDVFGFLGPNGSGKTTTIRMLLGLLRPTSGTVRLFGLDNATHLPEILPRVGAIIEAPVSYRYLSGYDNLLAVAMNSGMRTGPKLKQRINDVLNMVNLSQQARDHVSKYSLGMTQRLAIGMALLTDPELLLFDEPTNGLDPMGVHEIRQLLLRLAASGKTVILSSHILYEVQQVCNRVAILQKGHLLKQGEVGELLRGSERLLIRVNSGEQAATAAMILNQAQQNGAPWIARVLPLPGFFLRVEAPVARSSEIVALLAQQNIYLAEIRPEQNSLEEVFMQLVAPAEQKGNMAALIS